MVSLIAVPNQLSFARPIFLPSSSRNQQAVRSDSSQLFFGFSYSARGVVLRCKRFQSVEGDRTLEAEVLEFMKSSVNPNNFPSRTDLIQGGRKDLADAILQRGGWMTMGWDLEEEDGEEKEKGDDLNVVEQWKLSYPGKGQDEGEQGLEFSKMANEQETTESSSCSDDSQTLDWSSDRSVGTVVEQEVGVDGILNRLGMQRHLNFGLHAVKNDRSDSFSRNAMEGLQNGSFSSLASYTGKNGQPLVSPSQSTPRDTDNGIDDSQTSKLDETGDHLKPDSWRIWLYKRSGNKNFEAAEIDYDQSRNETMLDASMSGSISFSKDDAEQLYSQGKNVSIDHLKSRLKQLEVQLSRVLRLMKSNSGVSNKMDSTRSPDEVRDLSDACEFQENVIMKAQDELRSLRAKLAVLEGKMSMTVSDAHKVAEEKQKKIEHNRKALLLLRATCIVWANSGSEVLLAGSFDGWASRRKMEKSNTGIFSLCLKLYPGIYEIKFIVDGKWMVDPLRPFVDNNGYRNNLLFVSD